MTNVQINSQGKVYTANGQALLSTKNIQSLNVTPSTSAQTITAPSGTDGYSPVNVAAVTASIDSNISAENIKKDVQILGVTGSYEGSGGGSGSTPAERTVKANYYVDTSGVVHNLEDNSNVTLSASATSITNQEFVNKYMYNSNIKFVDLSAIESINCSIDEIFKNAFLGDGLSGVIEAVDLSSLVSIGTGSYLLSGMFAQQNNLTDVNLSKLTTITSSYAFQSCFSDCGSLETLRFKSLSDISTASMVFDSLVANCSNFSSIYFDALTSQSFGSLNNQFKRMLSGCSGVTVHFPSNLQSVIGSWSDVTAGFGGTNTTVLFDLPATN